MCYSASASFISAASLLPVSFLAVGLALRKRRPFLWLTLVPLFFAMQQAAEGMVWLSIGQANEENALLFSYAYLFFAFFFWPVYMPIAVQRTESDANRRKQMHRLGVIGWVLGVLMFGPILIGLVPVQVSVMQHSIKYVSYQSAALCYAYGLAYIAAGIAPFWASSFKSLQWLGHVIFLSLVISVIIYSYAFTSVWCYFVAMISILILLVVL